jgi:hypothetical protein
MKLLIKNDYIFRLDYKIENKKKEEITKSYFLLLAKLDESKLKLDESEQRQRAKRMKKQKISSK